MDVNVCIRIFQTSLNQNMTYSSCSFIRFEIGKLQKFEIPAAVTLCADVWTPELGLVTAALKVKRKEIQDRYRQNINRMYGC